MFRHPKYYKELRKRNKLDQAISLRSHDGERVRAPDPGPKQHASSLKPQATSSMIREPRKSFTVPEHVSDYRMIYFLFQNSSIFYNLSIDCLVVRWGSSRLMSPRLKYWASS